MSPDDSAPFDLATQTGKSHSSCWRFEIRSFANGIEINLRAT
jgi:hypothetical protein